MLHEFKTFIEETPRVYMYFTEMWDEVPRKPIYARDPTGHRQIRDYEHMLAVLNHTFGGAPEWTQAAQAVGMVGVPMCAIFDYAMGTPRFVKDRAQTKVNARQADTGLCAAGMRHFSIPKSTRC